MISNITHIIIVRKVNSKSGSEVAIMLPTRFLVAIAVIANIAPSSNPSRSPQNRFLNLRDLKLKYIVELNNPPKIKQASFQN